MSRFEKRSKYRKPRRFRGLDFFIRWSQGNWAEEISFQLLRGIIAPRLGARVYRYGPSAGRIPRDLREFDEIMQEMQALAVHGKRPNLLLFSEPFATINDKQLSQLMRKPDSEVENLVRKSILAVEVEHSMWAVKKAKVS